MRVCRLDEFPESQRNASPDGTRVLGWVVSDRTEDRYEDSIPWEIVVIGNRKIGPLTYFSSALSWSPDGERLTYVAESEGTWFKFNVDRKGAIRAREEFLTPRA